MTPHIWLNPYLMPVPALNIAYGYLKTVGEKGEIPFIVPRLKNVEYPWAINIYADEMFKASDLENAPNTSLEELMAQSATRILNNFRYVVDGKLYVWWSGGLDSTAILLTLLDESFFQDLLKEDRAVIVCDQNSKEEYPKMWGDTVSKLPILESNLSLYLRPKTFHVDGMWADELFGNYQAEYYPANQTDIVQPLAYYLRRLTYKYPAIEMFLDWASQIFEAAPLEMMDTVFRQLWWMEFCLAYQDATLRPYYNGSNRAPGPTARARFGANLGFRWFSHPSWSSWAYKRQLENKFSNYREAKQELRDYIYSRNKDQDYVTNKEKVYSQGRMYYGWKKGLVQGFGAY